MNKVFDGYERSVKKAEIGNAEFFREALIKSSAEVALPDFQAGENKDASKSGAQSAGRDLFSGSLVWREESWEIENEKTVLKQKIGNFREFGNIGGCFVEFPIFIYP